MNINLDTTIRTAAIAVVGLPLTIGLGGFLGSLSEATNKTVAETSQTSTLNRVKGDLTQPCVEWAFSDKDTKLEREAKNTIDDVLGSTASYRELCNWVLN
jgi:hypothetical protein